MPNQKNGIAGNPDLGTEQFCRVYPVDTLKRKQFIKGTTQIAQEGAIQIFYIRYTGMEEVIVGVVGAIQIEVLEYRLKNEYNVDIVREGLSYQLIRWIDNENVNYKELSLTADSKIVQDVKGNYLILFTSEWNIRVAQDRNKDLLLSEFGKN